MPEAKSLFAEFIESTTLHGIRNVFHKGSKLRRFVWLLSVLGSAFVFALFLSKLISSYLQHEVVNRVTIINQDNTTLPAVTICNFNPIRKSFVSQLNLSDPAVIGRYMFGETDEFNPEDSRKINGKNTDHFFLNASHKMEDMLLLCKLQGKKCGVDDFKKVVTNMGACYTSNFDKRLASSSKISSPGEQYGLTMVLNPQFNEYYELFAQAYGFKISVHNENDFPLVEGNGFAIMPGVSTFVAIKKKKVISLPAPFQTNCKDKKLIGKYLYTKPLCYEDCKTKYIAEQCGCNYDQAAGIKGLPQCTMEQLLNCVYTATEDFAKSSSKNCSCPVPCERISYEIFLSYGTFTSTKFEVAEILLEKNASEEDFLRISKTHAELKIFFQDLNYEIIEDVPKYSVQSLLAEAGGMLGLLLGASVLTLMEFLDFLTTLFEMKYSETRVAKKN